MLIAECSKELSSCCHDPGMISLIAVLKNIMDIIQIIVPILLIIYLSVQLIKMAMNPEDKKGMSKIKNMAIATIFVFATPVIINAFVNILPQSFQVAACWDLAAKQDEVVMSKSHKYAPVNGEGTNPLLNKIDDYEKGKEKVFGSKKAKEAGTATDDAGGLAAGDAQGILDGCKKVHTMYEQQKWFYYNNINQLKWKDIKYSTNNPSKATCCATFVGSAFLIGGVFTESEINEHNYNSVYGISELCQKHKWNKVTSYSSLQAGDVVIMTAPSSGSSPGHVQVYAGNGTWYNAGSTNAIQRSNPYASDAKSRFLYAWRKPA